jgi:hypothetical protein
MSDEKSLGVHNNLYFFEIIGDKGGAGGDNVEDTIGYTDGRRNLNRPCNLVNISVNVVFFKKVAQNRRIGSRYAFPFKPFYSFVIFSFGNR